MAMTKQTWSLSALSVELDIDRRTLGKRLSVVKPAEVEGPVKRYHMKDVIDCLYGARSGGAGPSYEAARARRETALAELKEMQVRQRKGELVERAAVARALFTVNRASRDAMANVPARVSGTVAAESDQGRVFMILTREIHQAMEVLSDEYGTNHATTKDPAPGSRPTTPR